MDEFKPEDELKPDPSDRRTGRSRQSSERVDEPQINFDDVELDADERRPSRTRKTRDDREEYAEEDYEAEENSLDEERAERRPRKRKKAAAAKPASRQYVMMGVGVLVLLLLIIGIGSALKAPSSNSTAQQSSSGSKNIDLSGNGSAADQANATQPAPGTTSAEQTAGAAQPTTGNSNGAQDISLPPISSTPSQSQAPASTGAQQRLEVQGDLNNALTSPQNQAQINNAVANSTLPTEPATVAPVRNGGGNATHTAATAENHTATTRPEHKQAVVEPKPQQQVKPPVVKAEPKAVVQAPAAQPKVVASEPVKAPTVAATTPKATTSTTAPAAPAATAAAPAANASVATGNVGSLKSAPADHYTLQLSSSSNYNNLNAWAKKENLKNFVVYQTTRNGQPWYVLVSGVYASKDDAKRAVAALPSDVQAKNPWAKPIHQVQADLK
ncbi:cell division protein DamX [Citrobacter sp. BDA59-3]|uniref:cell division protein DamX n=1 Tax=Citrobacter sp. BDA59-3 TaxID=2781952 RepID=UPI0018827587|nr:cell division protein DamX [Citrobacter sp. BDA59-3]QOV68476.1 cell division protein DamX [Citrobacter sp. BDA59-3]